MQLKLGSIYKPYVIRERCVLWVMKLVFQIDSSTEFQQLELKRDRLRSNIDSIARDIARMMKEKEEAENEMRNAVSMKMMQNDIQNDIHNIERQLAAAYGFRGPNYVAELDDKIIFEEKEIQGLKVGEIQQIYRE
ncbi:hypothetical protein COOONC_05966 [Cooperia oncophora]